MCLVTNTLNKFKIRKITYQRKAKHGIENDIMSLVKNDSGGLTMKKWYIAF